MANERLLTTSEIAQLLHVSRQTVTRWIREGRLEAIIISVSTRPIYRERESRFRAFVRPHVEGLE